MHQKIQQPTVQGTDATHLDLPGNGRRLPSRRLSWWKARASSPGLLLVLLLTLGSLAASSLQANPFYVAPNGNDNHPGTEAQPFRTIERARTAARAATSGQNRDVIVYLRGGRYELNETLRFDGNDSGRNGHNVIYRSFPGEQVSISGGRRVTGWTHFRDGIFRAPSPVNAYRQLYVNGTRGTRARTANGSFHRLTQWQDDKTIRIPGNQIQNWSNLHQVEMVLLKHWNHSRLRVASFHKSGDSAWVVPQDPERTVEWIVQWPNREPNQPYYFENSLDFLDQPGEWYLDRGQQQVYYMPRPGENLSQAEVIVPRLNRLLEVRGASNLQFIGLTFEHSNWTDVDNEGFVGIQAASYRVLTTGKKIPSAVYVESTQHVRFERNVFRNLGNGGLELASGTFQTQVIGNAFADIAGNGIAVYTLLSNRNPADHIRCRNDVIRNNYLTRIGEDYPGTVGIFASYTAGLIVEHNEISDLPYTAINLGWGWTNLETGTRDNVIRYNRIHNVMNLLDDGAGIYTLSKQHNSLIEENHIYNLVRNTWAGYYEIAALYLDEQSEGITMRNNVVQNLSGVMVWKQNRANSNTVHTNGSNVPNQQAIIDRAGLQSAFHDVRNLIAGPTAPSPVAGPFTGTPATIPGRLEAENFDHGGQSVAYNDTTTFNQGGQHRLTERVDIENTTDAGGGFNIGWMEAGEWLQYTVKVETSGTYNLHFRVASLPGNGAIRLLAGGKDLTGRISIPTTGGWQKWQTITVPGVSLQAGTQTLRLQVEAAGVNLNWFEAEATLAGPPITVSLTSPSAGSEFEEGKSITVSADAQSVSGSIVRVEFFSGTTKIGERTSAPFSFSWKPAQTGIHSLTARATNESGDQATSTAVSIEVAPSPSSARRPFNSEPATIPGRIIAVEFDHGGAGVAYHDTTSANIGGTFRTDEAVDIESSASGESFTHNVGWIAGGEWIEYTVHVPEAGTYQVDLRVASTMTSGHLRLQMDGKDITSRINVPNTGGWQKWTTVSVPDVKLKAGKQVLRLAMGAGEFNLGSLEFRPLASQAVADFNEWKQTQFPPEHQANAAISGPTADPDGDGVPNLLEYALNGNPMAAHTAGSPQPGTVKLNGSTYLTITYTRRVGATDLSFIIEASSDMVNWSSGSNTVPVSVTREGDEEVVVVRDALPLGQSSNRFLRLRVTSAN
jgi:hypothetical protein